MFIYLLFKLNSKNLFDREGDLYKAYGFEPACDLLEIMKYKIGCLIKGLRVILRVSARCLCQNIILWHIAFISASVSDNISTNPTASRWGLITYGYNLM